MPPLSLAPASDTWAAPEVTAERGAALLIAQGHHPKTIQEHLGHSSIRVTLDLYGHLYPSLTEVLRQGLEAIYAESRAAGVRPESDLERGSASMKEERKAPEQGFFLERTTVSGFKT